jgi:hypothetical protein
MSLIDVVIPLILGLVLLLWPQVMFFGAQASSDAKKLRLLRGLGVVLLLAAAVYLVVGFLNA